MELRCDGDACPFTGDRCLPVVAVDDATTLSPGFRRGWNFGDHQLVVGAALPLTRRDGDVTAAVLTYFSYELPFR